VSVTDVVSYAIFAESLGVKVAVRVWVPTLRTVPALGEQVAVPG
jgi:hypothetical protein